MKGWTELDIDKVATGSYKRDMRAVGLKILKNKLSEYVQLVARGETVLVTVHDKVVAELVPPREDRAAELSDVLLMDLVRHGLLSPPLIGSQKIPSRGAPVAGLAQLLDELDSDRSER